MKKLHALLWGGFFVLALFAFGTSAQGQEARPDRLQKQDRKIQPFDTITIEVFGEKDFSGDHRVQASGVIKYPFLGKVSVMGKTAAEVADVLQTALETDYLVNPQVTVTVKEYAARTINVTGEVTKPGSYPLPGEQRLTIVDGIGLAGGFTKDAKKGKIEFTRDGKTKTFGFDELREMNDPKKVIYLEPGDLINVPSKFF